MNRADILHDNFIERVANADFPEPSALNSGLNDAQIVDIFESQMMSRLLDITSRRLSADKQSFYTIGSSGHEGNAVFGEVFRVNDMAFLHYRSCAFALQRSKKIPGGTALYDNLLAFVASRDEPISGGRHKVIGSKALWIPPQTSTIASHLPKAVGAAHALGLYKNVPHQSVGLDDDGLVICSFGDASVNHSTAQGAINTAAWAAYQGSLMPLIFICEDNGIGISTATPSGWIEANYSCRPGLKYIACNGLDILDIERAAREAQSYARARRKPVFLHFKTVRLSGHAGSDMESQYADQANIIDRENHDPLLYSAATLHARRILSSDAIGQMYSRMEQRITRIARGVIHRPKLVEVDDIMSSVWPPVIERQPLVNPATQGDLQKKHARYIGKAVGLSRHINLALSEIMSKYANSVLFGQDIAKKGGVYGVTQGLYEAFGARRVTNTLLDEQSILGLAIGLGHCGFLPIAEIQFLAYVHNAEDQIRGEAATLPFFSNGVFSNPMVIRIAGFAYQKGFGGHFHNDNSFTVFRDIPGIVVAAPSSGSDAAQLLRIAVDLAHREQRVVIIIEPIALYTTLDLHQPGDRLWANEYQLGAPDKAFQYADINVQGGARQLCIVSYANGFYLSNIAAKILLEQHAIDCRLIDIRWLHPLPEQALIEATRDCDNILIVDECRRSGSVSEALMTLFVEQNHSANIDRLNAEDCFIPLGDAANALLPSADKIVAKALALVVQSGQPS